MVEFTDMLPPVRRPTGTWVPTHSRVPLEMKAGQKAFSGASAIGDRTPLSLIGPPEVTSEAWPFTVTEPPPPAMTNSLSVTVSVAA